MKWIRWLNEGRNKKGGTCLCCSQILCETRIWVENERECVPNNRPKKFCFLLFVTLLTHKHQHKFWHNKQSANAQTIDNSLSLLFPFQRQFEFSCLFGLARNCLTLPLAEWICRLSKICLLFMAFASLFNNCYMRWNGMEFAATASQKMPVSQSSSFIACTKFCLSTLRKTQVV